MTERAGGGSSGGRSAGLPPKKKRRRGRRDVSNAPNDSSSNSERSQRNAKRNKARAKRRAKQQRASKLRILQQNVASLKKRETELFNRMAKLDIDIAVLQECNFPICKDKKTGKITHKIPEFRGWNIEATPRQVGRASGSDSSGRGGVAILIRDHINYEVLTSKPIPEDDETTEYVGVRLYPDENKKEPIDIHNLYIPPINESAVGEDRAQRWNTSRLPTTGSTFIFSDTNCHGSWDSRLSNNTMSDDSDDWMSRNNFCTLNSADSYTGTILRGRKSSPDITVIPSNWMGKTRWSTLTKNAGGSDHVPILIDIQLPGHTPLKSKKRTNKKRQQRAKWSFKKADWNLFKTRSYMVGRSIHATGACISATMQCHMRFCKQLKQLFHMVVALTLSRFGIRNWRIKPKNVTMLEPRLTFHQKMQHTLQ